MAASAYPQVSRFLLQGVFQFFPPPCTTYLLTDEHLNVDDLKSDMKIFEPVQDTLQLARLDEDLYQEVTAHTDSEGQVHMQNGQSNSPFSYRSRWPSRYGRVKSLETLKHLKPRWNFCGIQNIKIIMVYG